MVWLAFVVGLYILVPLATALGHWIAFGRRDPEVRLVGVRVPVPVAVPVAVVAEAPAPPPIERGDLVDIQGTQYYGGVLAVDGDVAWCRVLRTKRLADIQNDAMPTAHYPVASLKVVSRGYLIPETN